MRSSRRSTHPAEIVVFSGTLRWSHIAGEHTVSSNALQRLSTKRRARCRSFETRASFWIQSYARLSTADAECSAPGAFIRTGVSFGWRDWGRIRRARAIKEPRSQVKVNSRSARPAAEDYSFWKLLDIGRLTELGWRQSTSLAEGIRITYRTAPSRSYRPLRDRVRSAIAQVLR